MTVREIIEKFRQAGLDTPAEDARLLVSHYTGMDGIYLRTHTDTPLPDPDGLLSRAVEARTARQPLQYLLGTWGFWRQEYEVCPDCLIPRADTETLVEVAIRHLPDHARFLDLCTGSGCVAISTLCERPDTSAVAVDLIPATLALARRNAARNNVGEERLTFLEGDVLQGNFLQTFRASKACPFDAILCNPPYIPTDVIPTLAPELAYEPHVALDGGEDGLLFYRRLLEKDYRELLSPQGFYAFEIGYDQREALTRLAAEVGWSCRIIKDFGGNDRVALITPSEKAV